MPVYHPSSKLGNPILRSDLALASPFTMPRLPWLLAPAIIMASHVDLLEGLEDIRRVEIPLDITQIGVVKLVVMAEAHIPSKDADLLLKAEVV